jgi:hypothetical protein
MLRHDVIAMEDYVATDAYPLHKCLADVASSDAYVGLIGWRYDLYNPVFLDNFQRVEQDERAEPAELSPMRFTNP